MSGFCVVLSCELVCTPFSTAIWLSVQEGRCLLGAAMAVWAVGAYIRVWTARKPGPKDGKDVPLEMKNPCHLGRETKSYECS